MRSSGGRWRVCRLAAPILAVLMVAVVSVAGCGTSRPAGAAAIISDPATRSPYRGTVLQVPLKEPDVRLTDTGGHTFDLRARTKGKLTLLYFGYTHCPDVCPTTMADLAATLRQLPAAQQARIAVVFVTSDPARDTPGVIRQWLDSFNASFIGLTGPFPVIQTAAKSVGVPIVAPVTKGNDYQVTHGAEVLAFDPTDQLAHVVYTSGTTSADYAHDLPVLLSGGAS